MSKKQTTNHIFMVRPANFGYNDETAKSNAFQTNDPSNTKSAIKQMAREEFDNFVVKLRGKGINVIIGEDSEIPPKPDAIFPNNWITFHDNGMVITYPMFAPARRREIDDRFIEKISQNLEMKERVHFEAYEEKGLFLEGTGSMIFDRQNQIVYACLSPRTHPEMLEKFCAILDCRLVDFQAVDNQGKQIYHTNVMMAVGETFVVICLDTIKEDIELKKLKATFEETNKEIIPISIDQMLSFAGNMLQVRNDKDDTFLVMSEQAFRSLNPQQIAQIEKHTEILYSPIPTIETYGGGSARCMMAEVFLPEKKKAAFIWQGHRGARGLLPENTIPAFIKALDFPIKTLELDVAVSKDEQVIVTHEPWFSAEICTKPDGTLVTKEEAKSLRILDMTYEEIKTYDCGQRPHSRFPDQQQIPVFKPSFKDMIKAIKSYCKISGKPLPFWSIEVKCSPDGDDIFHPQPEKFVDLIIAELRELNIYNRVNLQAFDMRILKVLHEKHSDMPIALLVENQDGVEKSLKKLGFLPPIYSCDYKLLNKKEVDTLHQKGIKVIPWTVNTKKEMRDLIEMGVDGIITDYPNYINTLYK